MATTLKTLLLTRDLALSGAEARVVYDQGSQLSRHQGFDLGTRELQYRGLYQQFWQTAKAGTPARQQELRDHQLSAWQQAEAQARAAVCLRSLPRTLIWSSLEQVSKQPCWQGAQLKQTFLFFFSRK